MDTGQGVHWSGVSGCALVRGVRVCTGQGCQGVHWLGVSGCALVRGVRVDTGSGVEWHIATRSIQKDF